MATIDLDTDRIKNWRSIITLIVFVLTNINVLFPFKIPLPVPREFANGVHDFLHFVRIIPRRREPTESDLINHELTTNARHPRWSRQFVWYNFPMNFVTSPLIADLFLLAILAIGRQEVHDGTVGANHIDPINIMVFFISLAYIAISIDASGLIRWLAFKVLQSGGGNGKRLYLYLYAFFFGLASFIGNDPVILSGTPFLAYMTRISRNIENPKAWIYTQFALANIASAILVSSNPTNLVLAGAFSIKFIVYTANIIVPVIATSVLLCPFLLFVLFRSRTLIPPTIKLHELPEHLRNKKPINPNIPNVMPRVESTDDVEDFSQLEEILNPYLDKPTAIFGAVIMTATLVTILAVNAATPVENARPVWWITLPAAFVMFVWDVTTGWLRRHESREIFEENRRQHARIQQEPVDEKINTDNGSEPVDSDDAVTKETAQTAPVEKPEHSSTDLSATKESLRTQIGSRTAVSTILETWQWLRVTFPAATTVLSTLPLPLVPFSLAMFVLVQALVTHGWVPVFAYGWNHWVNATGTVGAAGGIVFLAIILCNFAGTNIGTTILLSRVLQGWLQIHENSGVPISDRTFWVTIYSMSLGLNYGAFSLAFSASLAGLLWRDILARKNVFVRGWDFMRINFSIIAISTAVGCAVLIGEVYIVRNSSPYVPN